MKYNTFIFDFDGTIADTLPHILTLGQKYTKENVADIDVNSLKDLNIFQLAKRFNISPLKIPFIVNDVRNKLSLYMDKMEIFPHLRETLLELQRDNIKLGIVSSNKEENIHAFLSNNKLEIFDFVHCERNIFGKAKVLSYIIKKYSLDKEKTIYVGDEVRDIEACKKAGLDIAAVTWGFNSRKILDENKPTYLIDSPAELRKLT